MIKYTSETYESIMKMPYYRFDEISKNVAELIKSDKERLSKMFSI